MPVIHTMEKIEFNSEIPPSEWLAVGLLDGTWAGGKVMVTVDVISPMPKIHLVHLFAEKISKQNGFALIDTCFAYCPELPAQHHCIIGLHKVPDFCDAQCSGFCNATRFKGCHCISIIQFKPMKFTGSFAALQSLNHN
mgnify:CR=1 FL=1